MSFTSYISCSSGTDRQDKGATEAESEQLKGFSVRADGTVMMGHRLCIPDVGELRKEIMEDAHMRCIQEALKCIIP